MNIIVEFGLINIALPFFRRIFPLYNMQLTREFKPIIHGKILILSAKNINN